MKNNKNGRNNTLFYSLIIVGILAIFLFVNNGNTSGKPEDIAASTFVKQLKDKKISEITIEPNNGVYTVTGKYKETKNNKNKSKDKHTLSLADFSSKKSNKNNFTSTILPSEVVIGDITKIAEKNNVKVTSKAQDTTGSMWLSVIVNFLPLLIIGGFLFFMMRQSGQGGGPKMMGMPGKSKIEPIDKKKNKVRFTDVAGAEEEKQELVEVVEFLKAPSKFTKMGARIPAGVLLEGPPGTGKTLLAKAVAGEAEVPFFSMSGSEFVEMFVGMGASRVRDLFAAARKQAPSIVFIDEIDAVGGKRGMRVGGGNDEKEQTLNQLLIEMDGFNGTEGVIVIGATNRSDVLDEALLRAGRFDRKVLVGQPDVRGREAILRIHSKNKPLAESVDLKVVAQQTPGFVGADLENLLNESALVATRRNKNKIEPDDIDEAEDRVMAGPAKKDRKINDRERNMVAYHEAGHALIGLVLNDSRVVRKVTIVPRGRAGGYAISLPKEDRFLYSKKDLNEQIIGLLGGRAAEEIVFNVSSTGASNDFEQASGIARAMVTQYGMTKELGLVDLDTRDQYTGALDYSQETATLIDQTVRKILDEAYGQAFSIIQEHRDQHAAIAQALLEYETLNEAEILSLFNTGKMPENDPEPTEDGSAADYETIKKHLDEEDSELQAEEKREVESDKKFSDEADANLEDEIGPDNSTEKD